LTYPPSFPIAPIIFVLSLALSHAQYNFKSSPGFRAGELLNAPQKNIDQNLGIDKAKSSDAPGKLKPQRYRFLTMSPMLTLDETTVFYYTISANKDSQKQSGLIRNWVDTVAKSKAVSAAASNSRASSTLQASATSKSKSRPIKREGAVLDIHDIGGLSDHDEIQGAEREAALKSPPKNGVRATSSVSN
jgi:hypothetical protein